ncbi:unnamed protein product [Arctia plantaginis]|uniref:Uncharacterized protein n=1 Tax=Arctia plantaginis TaxID=874455 RepID=A0A8S0ZW43_ARCPL|nr:unnamed protein product [Arctia plantaginis]
MRIAREACGPVAVRGVGGVSQLNMRSRSPRASLANSHSRYILHVERLEIFRRQVEPWWEGAEAVSEGGTRALGLPTYKIYHYLVDYESDHPRMREAFLVYKL